MSEQLYWCEVTSRDDAGAAEDVRMGHIVLRGTLIGYLLIGTIVTGLALIGGAGMPASLWIGLFAAFWAGPGWGGMLALTVLAMRTDDAMTLPSRQRTAPAIGWSVTPTNR